MDVILSLGEGSTFDSVKLTHDLMVGSQTLCALAGKSRIQNLECACQNAIQRPGAGADNHHRDRNTQRQQVIFESFAFLVAVPVHAFAEHGRVRGVLPPDGGDAEEVVADFAREGVNAETLAADLQREGTESFNKSWHDLLACIASKVRSSTRPIKLEGTDSHLNK